MLMRFDPFRELDALNQALATAPTASRGTVMAMDAYRDGDRVVVHLFDVLVDDAFAADAVRRLAATGVVAA